MKKWKQQKFLLGALKSKKEDGNMEEDLTNSNIFSNHAYAIDDIREIQAPSKEILKLIKFRNHWQGSSWQGAYSEEDESWDEFKELKTILGFNQQNGTTEGVFWIQWSDFIITFNKLHVAKIFPPTWQQFSISDQWEGITAGGSYPTEPETGKKQDTNDKWFNNPQF